MKALITIFWLKILHPKATVYVRFFPEQQKKNKVYWQLSSINIGYYNQVNEIIVDTF